MLEAQVEQLQTDNAVKQEALDSALGGEADAAGGGKAKGHWGEKGMHAKQGHGGWLPKAAKLTAEYEAGLWSNVEETIAEYKWNSWCFRDAVQREAKKLPS